MGTAIVFVHRGTLRWLAHVLIQARRASPLSEIFVLGDRTALSELPSWVSGVELAEYSRGANALAGCYRHLSTLSLEFERFCFQRWFLVAELMARRHLGHVLHLDSDVMLYRDADDAAREYAASAFTLSQRCSGHAMFINKVEALDAFCEFTLRSYTEKDRLHALERGFLQSRATDAPGGICDMWLLGQFAEMGDWPIGETWRPQATSTFDHNINLADGFRTTHGMKSFHWKDGLPFARRARDGAEVRLDAVHFQGSAKSLIRFASRGTSFQLGLRALQGRAELRELAKRLRLR